MNRPTHPLDALLERAVWRRLTALAACVVAAGAMWVCVALFDLDLLQHVIVGAPYDRTWDDLVADAANGRRLFAVGGVAVVLALTGWSVAAWVHAEGGAYWLRRSRQARELLRKRGRPDPERHRLARAALELEEADGGWRPETVLLFVEATQADPSAPIERAWIDELRAWSVKTRVAADQALRGPGAVHHLDVGGVPYEAEDVATFTERIDRGLLDLRFRGV